MTHILFFSFTLLIPWVLGFAIVKPFLKQRYGHIAFALGSGYLLGWFVTTLLLRVYDYFQRPFDITEIVIIECMIALPLLFVKAKPCNMEEFRLEPTPSNLTYLLSLFVILLLLYRWGLTAVDLASKPVFPWDGWVSWSAKAKIFYEYGHIPHLEWNYSTYSRFESSGVIANGVRHPYFVSLIQTYTALGWGSWDDNVVNFPWLGASVAIALTIFGGLRYLDTRLLPALLAAYVVVSTPIFDAHISLGSYADIWVGYGLLVVVLLTVIFLTFNGKRIAILIIPFLCILYFTKHSSLVFASVVFILCLWRVLGGIITLISLLLFSGAGLIASHYFTDQLNLLITKLFSSSFYGIVYNPVLEKVNNEWLLLDNWHYLFIGAVGSIFILLISKKKHTSQGMILLLISGLTVLLVMLFLTFFSSKMSGVTFVGYFNRVTLYFMPVFALIPACVYQLIYKE